MQIVKYIFGTIAVTTLLAHYPTKNDMRPGV